MEVQSWHNETIGKRVVEALIKNDFDAVYVPTAVEASNLIMKHVGPGTTVGFGGSMTIKDMGIQDKVRAAGGKVFDHGEAKSPEEVLETARKEILSDLYLCSSNAVTLDGILVNVDGMGNRVAAMSFGPKKVIIAIGINKICKDEAAAFERLKTFASPMNNKRLERPNPCVETGVCANCRLESRICRLYSVMRKKPSRTDITVIIIGENCGY
jgi:hypothetical protein